MTDKEFIVKLMPGQTIKGENYSKSDYTKRLEQENETLKSQLDFEIQKNEVLEAKNARLEEENEILHNMTGLFSVRLCKKYETCLQEIKKIAEYSVMHNANLNSNYQLILQKIAQASEVRSVGVGLREQDEQDTEARLMRAQQDAECEVE